MKLRIGGACLALATTACAQQAPPTAGPAWSDIAPPAFMRYEPPTNGLIEARYDCFGKPVRMSLQVDRQSVRVLRYEDAAGRASDADLGR